VRRALPVALTAVLLGLLSPVAPAAAQAAEDVVWLCRPGTVDDPCEIPLDTTVRSSSGERVLTPGRPPQDARPVDCFYVYPTVSNDLTASSDRSVDPELASIAQYQAARFSSLCRVFAPVYRQGTLLSLSLRDLRNQDEIRRVAYADVEAAWRQYLAQDNGGRGVVLLGHSQGTRMLRALVKREIDPSPQRRRQLVGALLLGGNVTVAEGRTTGGDFQHVPVCTQPGQHGCVVAYSTFAEDPPDDSRYGRTDPGPDEVFGFPGGPGYEVACTDPGVLSGMTGPIGVTVPSEPFAPGPIAAGIVVTNGGPPPSAPTTWVTPADRFVGACAEVNGADVLRYDPVPGSRRPLFFPDPGWGTHLLDVNLGLERQVAIVAAQIASWQAATPPATTAAPVPARPAAAPRAAPAAAARDLPATGGSWALPAAVLLLGAAALRRRRPAGQP
jgi:hypothetical protein